MFTGYFLKYIKEIRFFICKRYEKKELKINKLSKSIKETTRINAV